MFLCHIKAKTRLTHLLFLGLSKQFNDFFNNSSFCLQTENFHFFPAKQQECCAVAANQVINLHPAVEAVTVSNLTWRPVQTVAIAVCLYQDGTLTKGSKFLRCLVKAVWLCFLMLQNSTISAVLSWTDLIISFHSLFLTISHLRCTELQCLTHQLGDKCT